MRSPSKYEFQFDLIWRSMKGPKLVKEYKFCDTRKWRVDFAHLESMTLIECEGAVWVSGRHTRGSGFSKDAEKYNHATFDGWAVIRLTPELIRIDYLKRIIELCKHRINLIKNIATLSGANDTRESSSIHPRHSE